MGLSFNEMSTNDTANVLVVDALNLAFRYKHAKRTDFRFDYIKTIESFARSYNCGTIIVAADWGSSSYRKGIYPEYKNNRKEMRENQTEEDKILFEEFFEEWEESLEEIANSREDWHILRYKGVEADDIAAFVVEKKSRLNFNKVWLISSDRDWDLLIENGVSRFSYVTRKEVTIENWADHYDVSPEEYISYKCLVGDKGDNVPGFKGVGDKRAIGLIQSWGSAMDIYDQIPLPSTYKFIQEINNDPEKIMLNYELMDLRTFCEEAIGNDNTQDIMRRLAGAEV